MKALRARLIHLLFPWVECLCPVCVESHRYMQETINKLVLNQFVKPHQDNQLNVARRANPNFGDLSDG